MTDARGAGVLATFCHAPRLGGLDIFAGLVAVDDSGDITTVARDHEPDFADTVRSCERAGRLVRTPPGTFMLPGFVDLHVHAPQYPQLGKALDVPLETWLQERTFPLEARYADLGFARSVYEMLVGDLIANGTTTCVYFATIHQQATRALVDACLLLGQRALVGKVAMDDPLQCPPYYHDASTDAALRGTSDLIVYVRAHPDNAGLVHPAVTPRFVPACTDATLAGLGAIAREWGCHVQTHCSESDWEHGHVLARTGRTDTQALDGFGLLGRRSVLAHGNFVTDSDMALIAQRGAGIAHCPLSNAFFANAVFPLRAALAKGVRVGLGTDIAGGHSASMFESCRFAIAASRMLQDGVDARTNAAARGRAGAAIDFVTALHLATAGGGNVLDLPVGRFAPGHHFDALLIDPDAAASPLRISDDLDTPADRLQKIVMGATRGNVSRVWIGGRDRTGG